jgi:hypothetical protein
MFKFRGFKLVCFRAGKAFQFSITWSELKFSFMSLLCTFKGADLYFTESKHISVEAAKEDQTEEEESLLNSFDVDDHEAAGTLHSSTTNTSKDSAQKKKLKHGNNQLASSLQVALEGVVIGTTLSDYQRYAMDQ